MRQRGLLSQQELQPPLEVSWEAAAQRPLVLLLWQPIP